jgi:hypothetical protein
MRVGQAATLAVASTMVALLALACSDPSAGSSSSPAAVTGTGESMPPRPTSVASPTPAALVTPPPTATSQPASPTAIPSANPTPGPTVAATDDPDTSTRRLRTFPLVVAADCSDLPAEPMVPLTLDFNRDDPSDAAMLTDRSDWNVHVVWPEGFSVGGDPLVLIDGDGDIVGRQGDDVRLPIAVDFPGGPPEDPAIAEGVLFGRCYRRAVTFESGSVVTTVADRLRLRSAPGADAGSPVVHPGLSTGSRPSVLDGPVTDNGLDWYRVETLDSPAGGATVGWIAVGPTGTTEFVERASS